MGPTEGELNLRPTALNAPKSYNYNATRLLSQLRFEILELVLENCFARMFLRMRKSIIYDSNV